MKRVFAFIFARGGSKGLPRKNLLEIKGLSLTRRAIKAAKQIEMVEKVFLSTDCQEIHREGEIEGVEVIKRPEELASDSASEWDAWKHAINYAEKKYGNFDIFVSLPPTAPCRSIDDVRICISNLKDDIDLVFTATAAKNNPWFNMVMVGDNGEVSRVIEDGKYSRRQDAPEVYNMTTVAYVARKNYIKEEENMWKGKSKMVEVMEETAIDIDTIIEFNIAKFLIESSAEG